MLDQKACLNKTEITLSGFTNHSKINPEINKRKLEKSPGVWILTNKL